MSTNVFTDEMSATSYTTSRDLTLVQARGLGFPVKLSALIQALNSPPPPVGGGGGVGGVGVGGPTCSVETVASGFGGSDTIRIFGGGFLPQEFVNIIEFESIATTTTADQLGQYSVELAVARRSPPVLHTYRAHGQTSSRTSSNAGITL